MQEIRITECHIFIRMLPKVVRQTCQVDVPGCVGVHKYKVAVGENTEGCHFFSPPVVFTLKMQRHIQFGLNVPA